jgi:ATP-dependent exoDNAse (exonuclease V) beta subunit
MGNKVHYAFEMTDFKNPIFINDDDKKYVLQFLEKDIFKNIKEASIYKEYEFIYDEDGFQKRGSIDLMVEYNDYIDIIDYKFKNIDDDNYIKQLLGYKKYISTITNKKINTYLYSIINNVLKKIDI